MDGDFADLTGLARLRRKYGFLLVRYGDDGCLSVGSWVGA